jgi:hypothetical protein
MRHLLLVMLLWGCNQEPLPREVDAAPDVASSCEAQLWTTVCCPNSIECAACTEPQLCEYISAECCPVDRCPKGCR